MLPQDLQRRVALNVEASFHKFWILQTSDVHDSAIVRMRQSTIDDSG